MFRIKIWFILLLFSLVNYVVITTVVDIILMGALHFGFSLKYRLRKFVIIKPNRIDFQSGNECSAFSAAYVLRHHDIEKSGPRFPAM